MLNEATKFIMESKMTIYFGFKMICRSQIYLSCHFLSREIFTPKKVEKSLNLQLNSGCFPLKIISPKSFKPGILRGFARIQRFAKMILHYSAATAIPRTIARSINLSSKERKFKGVVITSGPEFSIIGVANQ